MKCPICGSNVIASKKHEGYYLCHTCKKRFKQEFCIADTADELPGAFAEAVPAKPEPEKAEPEIPETTDKPENDQPAKPEKKKGWSRPSILTEHTSKSGRIIAVVFVLLFFLLAGLVVIKSGILNKPAAAPEEMTDTPADAPPANFSDFDIAEVQGLRMQILEMTESEGDDMLAPGDGRIFLYLKLRLENGQAEDLDVSHISSFEAYSNDMRLAYSADAYSCLTMNTDSQTFDGTVKAGEALEGFLCLEPPADWKNITLHYADRTWKDETITFSINRSSVTNPEEKANAEMEAEQDETDES